MLRVTKRTQVDCACTRAWLMGLAALLASGCSSIGLAIACEDSAFLRFEPALSDDGEYEMEVDLEGVRTRCFATIANGEVLERSGCSGGAGPSFEMELGGHTIVETETRRVQSRARTIDGLTWYSRSYLATVTMKRDGVEIPARPVYFFQDAQPLEDCDAARMVGTFATE